MNLFWRSGRCGNTQLFLQLRERVQLPKDLERRVVQRNVSFNDLIYFSGLLVHRQGVDVQEGVEVASGVVVGFGGGRLSLGRWFGGRGSHPFRKFRAFGPRGRGSGGWTES